MKDIGKIQTTKMHPSGYKAWVKVKVQETIEHEYILDADGETEAEAIEALKKKHDTL